MPTQDSGGERRSRAPGPASRSQPDYFAEAVAARYDEVHAASFRPEAIEPIVDLLAALASERSALEFGVGTGRIAIPLAARGGEVHGIDLSASMLARLRAKDRGARIGVTEGDFTTARAPGVFSLVYLVFNTICNLTSQDAQVECFRNAARHLEPGGRFLVEVFVPDLRRLPPGETTRAFDLGPDHVGIDEYEPSTQRLVSHHFVRRGDAFERRSIPFRYVWPAELDLMARIAGLRLESRWGGWKREPFDGASRSHVSVWRRTV